jgi:DNA-binding winged helix-turn-helix (wHTH) protein
MGVFHFCGFTLDPARYVLRRGEKEIALRPKAFDVLKYLVERAGATISKEELFEAVWDGAARTDGSVVQCIRDIREALADNDHQIVKAVPKRGYVFTADVSVGAIASAPAAVAYDGPQSPPAPPRHSPRVEAGLRLPRVSRLVAIGAGALTAFALVAVVTGRWIASDREPAAAAAHYAILARAIGEKERSANANRQALALYGKALAIEPDHVPALLGYAQVLLVDHIEKWSPRGQHAARLEQAEGAIERAIALEPANARAYYYRGILWRARRDPARAIAAVQQALALDPTYVWARAELGRAKIDAGRSEEAIQDIETALRLSPGEPRKHVWHFWAGLAALHAGKDEAAMGWLLKARAAGHRRPRLIFPALAVAYAGIGREDEARAVMAEYLAQVPQATVSSLMDGLAHPGAAVATQRERITVLVRRLGVPEASIRTSASRK